MTFANIFKSYWHKYKPVNFGTWKTVINLSKRYVIQKYVCQKIRDIGKQNTFLYYSDAVFTKPFQANEHITIYCIIDNCFKECDVLCFSQNSNWKTNVFNIYFMYSYKLYYTIIRIRSTYAHLHYIWILKYTN